MKPDLQHKTLAMADCDYSKVVITKRTCGAVTHFAYYPLNSVNMKQKFNSGGRPPKINSTAFRCSVNFTATELAQLLTMQEKSGIASLSAFIKTRIFGKSFKVFVVDENTRLH